MKLIPVLDLQHGRVVRGIGGRRGEYQPLTPESEPIAVAISFRERFGLDELYVADLDAIAGKRPATDVFAKLRELGFRLWVDAGVTDALSAETLFTAGIDTVVAGLETVTGPTALSDMCKERAEQVIFSLDLREGIPVGAVTEWKRRDARSIADQAVEVGVKRLLLLDLVRVGTGTGTGTEGLASELISGYPGLEVAVGGGIRHVADLRRLKTMGVNAVLVASALHDGRIRREDLERLSSGD